MKYVLFLTALFIAKPLIDNNETPSGYSTVELGYTDNSGSKIVLKNDFNGCETGWEWFYLPSPTKLDGPASFWLRASTGSYVRRCNGNLSTGSFQPK